LPWKRVKAGARRAPPTGEPGRPRRAPGRSA
jgi:hypothetical protein